MGSRASSSVPFYADILVVVPSVISFVVVVVLLSLVYIIFTRKPRHPNDIYGAPSLQLFSLCNIANLDLVHRQF